MMFSKISRMAKLLVVIIIFFAQSTWGMVYNIKGTYDVVEPEYQHLSFLHGAILWETGFVRRLYDFGELQKKLGKDKVGRTVIESYEPSGHDTVKLAYALFYRVPGSSSVTDFGETKQIDGKITDEQILDKLASVLAQCNEARKQLPVLHEALKVLVSKSLETKVEKSVRELQASIVTPEAQNKIKTLKQQAPKDLKVDVENVSKALLLFLKPLADSQKNLKEFLKKPAYLNMNLAQSLAGSLIESNPTDDSAIYLPYMTEMIILAFVYKKFGFDKTKFQYFYNKLNETLDNEFLIKELPLGIEKSVESKCAGEMLQKLFEEKSQDYEHVVFLSTQLDGYPTPNGYATADYSVDGKKIDSIPDCMDNAFRNFIRLLAYDSEKQNFEGGILREKAFPLREDLKEFLKKYNNRRTDASRDAHSEWLNVISNIKHVLYNRTKDDISYELQPCVRNIIVLLDYLLGLDLFKEKNLETEVTRPDFIKTYFKPLCDALGCKGILATNAQAQQQDDNVNFDELDLTSQVFTTFEFKNIACQFMTKYQAHGELSLRGSAEDIKISQTMSFDKIPSLSLVVTDLKNRSKIKDIYHLSGKFIYSNFFALMLDNTNAIGSLLGSVPVLNFTGSSMKNILDLLLRLNDKQPDERVRTENKKKLLNEFVAKGCQEAYPMATKEASKGAKSQDYGERINALELFTALVNGEYKDAYKEAAQAAHDRIKSQDQSERVNALQLYIALIKRGYKNVYEEAAQVAQDEIKSENWQVKAGARDLFINLLKQQQAFTNVTKTARELMTSKDSTEIAYALQLFRELVERGYKNVYEEAAQAAQNGIECEDWKVKGSAMNLFKALVDQGKAFTSAPKIALEWITFEYAEAKIQGLRLFKALVKQGESLNEAREAANLCTHDEGRGVSSEAKKLLKLIEEKSK